MTVYKVLFDNGTVFIADTRLLMTSHRKFPFGLLYWLDNYFVSRWETIEKMS